MFFLETKNKRDCYGCRACEKKCPEHCIKMFYDEEGFSYPVINESLCKHCGLCKFVCPNDNIDLLIKNNKIDKPIGYMAIHKNTYIRFKSASGGAFSAIVERLSKENIIVFGAELDQYFKAIHSYADTIQGAHKFRKSKYIQSDIGDSYRQAECFLKKGKNVLFTGTPCQVAGLKLYLQKEYINLFTADFVCRGVPSQNVFDLYLLYLRKRYGGGEITYFTFRYKTYSKLQKWNSRNIKAVINGKSIIKNHYQDLYLRGYYSSLFYRPSCYVCKFATPHRISDITMMDFWKVNKIYPDENPHQGVSAILANTEKGKLLVASMHDLSRLAEIDLKYIKIGQMMRPTPLNPKREIFFDLLRTTPFDYACKKCIPYHRVLRSRLSQMIPENIKMTIKKYI